MDSTRQMAPDKMLEELGGLYRQRNKLYGDNYKRFGAVMVAMFPNGYAMNTVDDFNRFGIFVQMVAKMTRYAENFDRGGHLDSLNDLAVYSMMLQELDQDATFKSDIPL